MYRHSKISLKYLELEELIRSKRVYSQLFTTSQFSTLENLKAVVKDLKWQN